MTKKLKNKNLIKLYELLHKSNLEERLWKALRKRYNLEETNPKDPDKENPDRENIKTNTHSIMNPTENLSEHSRNKYKQVNPSEYSRDINPTENLNVHPRNMNQQVNPSEHSRNTNIEKWAQIICSDDTRRLCQFCLASACFLLTLSRLDLTCVYCN